MGSGGRIIAGAMSGTSADGVDVALVRVEGRGLEMGAELIGWRGRAFSPMLRAEIMEIRSGRATTMAQMARVGREISLCYAAAVNEVLVGAGLHPGNLAAVAAHGQTLFHDPPNTIQWLDAALVAAEVGCVVVSDFRRADCAAGGQGAPLVPLADYLLFRDARKSRVMLNIGGIANLTFLAAGAGIERLIAFDTGPGNCVSDYLMRREDACGPSWDAGGERAARGTVCPAIVEGVLADGYFERPPPKSTDGPAMIEIFERARSLAPACELESLLSSTCAVAAASIGRAVRKFLPLPADEVIVSGGGTANQTLMRQLREEMGDVPVRTIDELGIPSAAKEAVAFALLGAATLDGVAGNVPAATGARRGVVLGSVTPRPGKA